MNVEFIQRVIPAIPAVGLKISACQQRRDSTAVKLVLGWIRSPRIQWRLFQRPSVNYCPNMTSYFYSNFVLTCHTQFKKYAHRWPHLTVILASISFSLKVEWKSFFFCSFHVMWPTESKLNCIKLDKQNQPLFDVILDTPLFYVHIFTDQGCCCFFFCLFFGSSSVMWCNSRLCYYVGPIRHTFQDFNASPECRLVRLRANVCQAFTLKLTSSLWHLTTC